MNARRPSKGKFRVTAFTYANRLHYANRHVNIRSEGPLASYLKYGKQFSASDLSRQRKQILNKHKKYANEKYCSSAERCSNWLTTEYLGRILYPFEHTCIHTHTHTHTHSALYNESESCPEVTQFITKFLYYFPYLRLIWMT